MATSALEFPKETKKDRKGKSLRWMIPAGVLLLASVAGSWLYRAKLHLPLPGFHSAAAGSAGMGPGSVKVTEVALDPFVVNLAGGAGYLKVAMTLAVRDGVRPQKGSGSGSAVLARSALARDTILDALSSQDAGTLLTEEGRAALKTALKAALNQKVPGLELDQIYFTDFLVEH